VVLGAIVQTAAMVLIVVRVAGLLVGVTAFQMVVINT
jgi:hypothetical protein